MKNSLLYFTLFCTCSFLANSQTISINAAHSVAIGNTVTVKGIVTNGSELGIIRYIQDGTRGIAVYGSSISTVNRGDSLMVTATTSNYNNLLELTPISTFSVTSIANPLPAPVVLTPNQYDETNESELIETANVVFTNGGGVFAGNTNYTITSGGQSGTVRINNGNPLVGTFIPVGAVTIRGILSQFCTSPTTGCTTGYQVLLRDINDIILSSPINITSPLTQSNIAANSFDVNWTTDVLSTSFVKYGLTPAFELGTANAAGTATSHLVSLTGLTPGSIYYVKAFSVVGNDTAVTTVKLFATASLSSGNIKVYFNSAVNNTVSNGTNAVRLYNAIDDTLIQYINRAKYTLDLTIYVFDNNNISNITTAINNAYNRGVKVRFISDGSESATNTGVNGLNAGIQRILSPVGGVYGIMHNKFVIIDANSANPMDPFVWTGATNWSDNQINSDPNDVIIFQDQSIARTFRLEFEEMWGDTGLTPNLTNSKFGPLKTDNTPHEFLVNGKRVEVYFSPSDGVNSRIIEKINSANSDIEFASMIITRTDIANAISARVNAGVSAFGITNDQSATTTWPTLSAALNNNMLDYAYNNILHHKYVIIDQSNVSSDPILLAGSHNWSSSAETRNDENTVVVHDATVANIYYQEFMALFTNNAIDIKETERSNKTISMFPNPAGNILTVQCDAGNPLQSVSIYSIEGKKIMEKVIHSSNESSFTFTIDYLQPGIYFVQFKNKNGIETLRLIKQ